jgi:hypothetical protein
LYTSGHIKSEQQISKSTVPLIVICGCGLDVGVGEVIGSVVVVVTYVIAVNPTPKQGSTYGVRLGVGVGLGVSVAVITGVSQLKTALKSITLQGSVVVVVVIHSPE